jgi:hypothetical protein
MNNNLCVTSVFTIYFEDPFWVGVLEENYNKIHYMGKHIFGAEPSNSDLLYFYIHEIDKIKKGTKSYWYRHKITKSFSKSV